MTRYMLSIRNAFAALIALLASANCYSHVRWFVDAPTNTQEFAWTPIYFVLIALAAVYCIACFLINRRFEAFYQHPFFKVWPKANQWYLLSYACGITFVFISFENIFIAPNIEIVRNLETFLIIQAVCGIVLLTALPRWIAGLAILLLCAMTVDAVPVSVWIDYIFEFVAVGLAICLFKWAPMSALAILRIGLGLQLMVLATHNKLMEPALGLAFLNEYNWNFMSLLGLHQFDDLLFVFSAGIAELTFGLLIMWGVATRFVVLCVSFFFTLTSVMLGMHELIGHVPILACCLVLYSLGGGYSSIHLVRMFSSRANKVSSPFNVEQDYTGIKVASNG